MITRLSGILTRVLDDEVRLEIGPIEYQILVPEAVRRLIQTRLNSEVTLHISEYLEGNSGGNRFIPRRIGFLTEMELEFFDLFCTVEKIGSKKALKAMARPINEIAEAISRQDVKWLSTLPGIGPTTAEQIVTALKRKVASFLSAVGSRGSESKDLKEPITQDKRKKVDARQDTNIGSDGKIIEEIYEALMSLGLTPMEARGRLDSILTAGKPIASVQDGIAIAFATK